MNIELLRRGNLVQTASGFYDVLEIAGNCIVAMRRGEGTALEETLEQHDVAPVPITAAVLNMWKFQRVNKEETRFKLWAHPSGLQVMQFGETYSTMYGPNNALTPHAHDLQNAAGLFLQYDPF